MKAQGQDHRRGRRSVVIVGGGIAGLYCARHLAEHPNTAVTLLEADERLGGRIETCRDLGPFTAEFGPMRFEPELQPKFMDLCDHLGIDRVTFPAPGSPPAPFDYHLTRAEEEARADPNKPISALDLLKLGLFRLASGKNDHLPGDPDRYRTDLETWLRGFKRSREAGRLAKREMDLSTQRLAIPKTFPLDVELLQLGFWNALSNVLSHHAIMAIRDTGTFYHLIPDNPNAAEWAVWWLRLLPYENLATIPTGVETVVTELVKECETERFRGQLFLRRQHEVIGVEASPDPAMVRARILDRSVGAARAYSLDADDLFLALPKRPLLRLSDNFPRQIQQDLDCVFGFPMLKAFLVKANPFWRDRSLWDPVPGEDRPPRMKKERQAWEAEQAKARECREQGLLPVISHFRADATPTRELHYFYNGTEGKDVGMVMVYTDQPASQYWRHYVVTDPQRRADIFRFPEDEAAQPGDPERERRRVKARLLHWSLVHYLGLAEEEVRAGQISSEDFRSSGPIRSFVEERYSAEAAELLRRVPPMTLGSNLSRVRPLRSILDSRIDKAAGAAREFRHRYNEVTAFGIRDWSRDPYGAGNHAWKPGVRWWEVLERLKSFGLAGRDDIENVHVCGEAYSDWHGFIEGALNSAHDAMERLCRDAGCEGPRFAPRTAEPNPGS